MLKMLKYIVDRVEWALWQKLLPDRFHRFVTRITLTIMGWRLSEEVILHWCWEMTPMPCGFPFPHQHLEGIEMTIRGPSGWEVVAKRSDDRLDRQLNELRERRHANG